MANAHSDCQNKLLQRVALSLTMREDKGLFMWGSRNTQIKRFVHAG